MTELVETTELSDEDSDRAIPLDHENLFELNPEDIVFIEFPGHMGNETDFVFVMNTGRQYRASLSYGPDDPATDVTPAEAFQYFSVEHVFGDPGWLYFYHGFAGCILVRREWCRREPLKSLLEAHRNWEWETGFAERWKTSEHPKDEHYRKSVCLPLPRALAGEMFIVQDLWELERDFCAAMRARASADTALAVEVARREGLDELLKLGMTDNHCWFMGFTTKERAAWEASDALVLPQHPTAILVKNGRAALFHGDKALSPLARFYGQKLRRREARRLWQEREARSSHED